MTAHESAAPSVDEKLNQRGTPGKARRNLKSLRPYVPDDKPIQGTPSEVEIRGVEASRWRLVGGKGDDAEYEQVGSFEAPRPLSEVTLPGDGPAARIWNAMKRGKR